MDQRTRRIVVRSVIVGLVLSGLVLGATFLVAWAYTGTLWTVFGAG